MATLGVGGRDRAVVALQWGPAHGELAENEGLVVCWDVFIPGERGARCDRLRSDAATRSARRWRAVAVCLHDRGGEVVRFVVQLEYWFDGAWREGVRYDHDRDASSARDIAEEGLHVDVYRERGKVRTEGISGPIPANDGFDAAE